MEHDCDGNDHHIKVYLICSFFLLIPGVAKPKAKGIALRRGGLLIAGSPDKCETLGEPGIVKWSTHGPPKWATASQLDLVSVPHRRLCG